MQHNITDTHYYPLGNKTEHLRAENESLKRLLQEYQQIVVLKEQEQSALQQQVSAGIESTSSLQNQLVEIQTHKNDIHELLQKTAVITQRENELEKEAAGSVIIAHQLKDIKAQYDYLQVQLASLEEQLQQLTSQKFIQQQSASRIAELESLLANTEEELIKIKNGITNG